MFTRLFCLVAMAASIAGCATQPHDSPAAQVPWQDVHFSWDPTLVGPPAEDIFRLDPQMAQALADPDLQRLEPLARARRLMAMIFGAKRDRFSYEAGHSTVAADTALRQRGDCISLTVLTYAAARALRLDAEIQEVSVPIVYDRRDGYEFVNHHVNLRIGIPRRSAFEAALAAKQLVVDFDPDGITGVVDQQLTERQVVARFYSNLGAEFLTQGNRRQAYALLKAAVLNDPTHGPSYTNLALLYRRDGMDGDAERLLRLAMERSAKPETPMRALLDLLQEQHRSAEAAVLVDQLRARQELDPHYWISRGAGLLADGHPADAVKALERAQALSSGFGELHRQLAIAYWQIGKRAQAREQVALLAAVEGGIPLPAKFRKMMQTP